MHWYHERKFDCWGLKGKTIWFMLQLYMYMHTDFVIFQAIIEAPIYACTSKQRFDSQMYN